ncbi:MAG: substrate-binding domain-containing protein, partial [Xanthomonadaceae bacterium]|nr:substrate-binding domain-containing protein [Xanthomonadaceae bacterium]
LTTVRQDWQEVGTLLARKVLALIQRQTAQSEVLPVTLVLRAT